MSNKLAGGRPQASSAEVQFLAGRVGDRHVLAVGQRSPKLRQVAARVRVDHGQIVRGGDLHQAQLRPERVFRHKFGIDADAVGMGEPMAEIGELQREVIVSCDTEIGRR